MDLKLRLMVKEKMKNYNELMTWNPAMVSLMIIIISLLFVHHLIKKKKKNNKRESSSSSSSSKILFPGGPRKLPIIGNLHQMERLAHRCLEKLSRKHGDLMFLQLGLVPTLVVSSADRARQMFKSHDSVVSGRPLLNVSRKISYDFSSITVAPYGDYWREIRKVAVAEIMTVKRNQSFGHIRVEEVASMLDQIATAAAAVDFSSLAFSLTNNIVCRVAFGSSVDRWGKRSEFQAVLHELQHLWAEFNIAQFFPGMLDWVNRFNGVDRRLDKAFRNLDQLVDKIIDDHLDPERPQSDVEDLIDVMIATRNNKLGSCQTLMPLTNKQIKAVIIDIFAAGTETSAASMAWTMAELMRNPSVKQKAEQEVRQVARGKAHVDETDLPKLVYLKHVIKESMRLHPPLPIIPRETTDNIIIDNKYRIPAKTRVLFNVAAISSDPKYWENPQEFQPERFMNSQVDFKGLHFELLPFGAGRRGCPGINLATPLIELALANLLFRFDFKLPHGMSEEDLDMEEAPGLTVTKKTPLCLVASPVTN